MKNINIVALYEFRLLMRDWTFRLLVIAGAALVLGEHVLLQCVAGTGIWDMVAFPASVPFLGTYLLNFVQVFMLFFVGMTFCNGKQKIDTVAAYYSRPVGNTEYMVGKTLGACMAIGGFDVVVLIALLVTQLLFSPAPFGLFYYVFYPLTLLLPALVFWSGMVLWMKSKVPHRGLTLLLMVGVFMCCFLLAANSFWGIDVFGQEIPNIFSDLSRGDGMFFFLSQRLFILLLGTGLWWIATTCWDRLPNDSRTKRRNRFIGVSIIAVTLLFGAGWWWTFRQDDIQREYYRECQKHWENITGGLIRTHDIHFVRRGKEIEVESKLVLHNAREEEMPELVFYLNPGLEILTLVSGKDTCDYRREGQVVTIRHPLSAGDSVELYFRYRGRIDERVCYLDIPEEKYKSWKMDPDYLPYRAIRRFSYVGDRYTLLTPECLWYPVTDPPVHLESMQQRDVQFTRYKLNVRKEGRKVMVSQGHPQEKNGWIIFEKDHAYPGLSLCIGDYEWKRMKIEGTLFELYYFKGHNFFTSRTAPDGLGVRRVLESPYHDDIAKWVGPPARVALVETPLSYWAYERAGCFGSEFVQAEIIFAPEYGLGLSLIPFGPVGASRMKELLPDPVLATFFWETLSTGHDYFIGQVIRRGGNMERINKRYVKQLLSDYRYSLKSDRFPAINVLFQRLKQKWYYSYGVLSARNEGKQYLRERSFTESLQDRGINSSLRQQIYDLKVFELKRELTSLITEEEWDHFVSGFFSRNLYRNVDLDTFCEDFKERYNIDLLHRIENLYESRGLSYFRVKDVMLERIDGVEWAYMCRAKVWNQSEVDGLVTMFCNNNGFDYVERNFPLKAGECKEFNVKFTGEELSKFYIVTNLSQNIPEEFGMTIPIRETLDTVTGIFDIDTMCFAADPSEIITDNRDAGFKKVDSCGKAWLTRNAPARKSIGIDQNMVYTVYDSWQTEISISCYGDTIQDMHYMTATGKGNYAEWNATLPEDGTYEVWVFNPRNLMELIDISIYNYAQRYTVYAWEKKIVEIDMFKEPQGWVKIGKYDFKAGAAKVVLHDDIVVNEGQKKRNAFNWSLENDEKLFPVIFADAVKWVRVPN